MDTYNKQLQIEKTTTDSQPRLLAYPALLDTLQVSLARQLHSPGALEAHSFDEVLAPLSQLEQERLRNAISERFDDELLYFVTCALLLRKNKTMIITAEASEGFDGYLPWEAKLQQHITDCRNNGTLPGAQVMVERYTHVASLQTSQNMGAVALSEVAA